MTQINIVKGYVMLFRRKNSLAVRLIAGALSAYVKIGLLERGSLQYAFSGTDE